METVAVIVVKILIIACPVILVIAVIFGKQPKETETVDVWRKLDEHEKALGE